MKTLIDFSDISDSSLMLGVTYANVNAFKLIYHRYYPQLHHFACTITHSPGKAAGLCNAAFYVLWQRRRQIDIDQYLYEYLRQLVTRLSDKYQRTSPPDSEPASNNTAVEFTIFESLMPPEDQGDPHKAQTAWSALQQHLTDDSHNHTPRWRRIMNRITHRRN